MITVLDTCTPSLIFLVFSITAIAVYSIKFYTEPVDAYCRRQKSPDDCGEKRQGYPMQMFIGVLLTLLWVWILNIVCHTLPSIFGWLLLCIPFVFIILLSLYYQIPSIRGPFLPSNLGFV